MKEVKLIFPRDEPTEVLAKAKWSDLEIFLQAALKGLSRLYLYVKCPFVFITRMIK